jgi:hypothetical protein
MAKDVRVAQEGGVQIITGSELLAEQRRGRDPEVRKAARVEAERTRRSALRKSARPVTVRSSRRSGYGPSGS